MNCREGMNLSSAQPITFSALIRIELMTNGSTARKKIQDNIGDYRTGVWVLQYFCINKGPLRQIFLQKILKPKSMIQLSIKELHIPTENYIPMP